jgi:oxygen-dependent protoporphyrinogen oxidase
MGGALGAAALEGDDAEIAGRARRDLGDALGVVAEPRLTRVHRHPVSMPQYGRGHLARVEAIEHQVQALPGLALAGSGYRGVGISDCVRSGETAAERALADPVSGAPCRSGEGVPS